MRIKPLPVFYGALNTTPIEIESQAFVIDPQGLALIKQKQKEAEDAAKLQASIPPFDVSKITVSVMDSTVIYRKTIDLTKEDIANRQKSSDASNAMKQEIQQLHSEIKQVCPSIEEDLWDFTLKDGALQAITQDLSEEDQNWLAEKLKSSTKLLQFSKAFVQAAASYWQPCMYVGKANVPLKEVQRQLNGTLPLKEIIMCSCPITGCENLNGAVVGVSNWLTFDKFYKY